jgi:hypothetical protein
VLPSFNWSSSCSFFFPCIMHHQNYTAGQKQNRDILWSCEVVAVPILVYGSGCWNLDYKPARMNTYSRDKICLICSRTKTIWSNMQSRHKIPLKYAFHEW